MKTTIKFYIKRYIYLALISGFIIFLDQCSKNWIRSNMALGEVWTPWESLSSFFRIIHWSNTGVAFGLFQGKGLLFTFLAFIVAAAIIYYFPLVPESDWSLRLAMGMQLGGAVGNLIDRIQIGHVTDFISVGTFPVFNIADSSITIGVGILLIGVWLQNKEEDETPPVQSNQENGTKKTSEQIL